MHQKIPLISQTFALAAAGAVVFLALGMLSGTADGGVYRCEMPDGEIRFSSTREAGDCRANGVETPLTGWDAGMPQDQKGHSAEAAKQASQKPSPTVRATKRQNGSCARKRAQLERVEWRLKRGYKASEGPSLRRRAQEYEDYLREHCRR